MRGARARFLAGAAVAFTAGALLAAWNGLGHLSSAYLAGGATAYGELAHGDYLQTSYRLWQFGHQLGAGRAPWIDPYSFQPETPHAIGLGGWPFGLLLWPVYALAGPVVAWNVFTLVAIAAGGALACWWLRELGVRPAAAIVGGLAFELAPYRIEQSTGHLLGPISILLPLALACFERGLRGSRWWQLGAVLALASIPLSGQVHLALGAVPFFLLYALCRTRESRALVAAAVAAGAAALAGLAIQRGVIAHSVVAGGRDFHALTQYSAWPVDFVSRTQRHGSEQFVFLGWATVVAAIAGLVVLARERRRGLAVALGLGVVLPVAAALGSHFVVYRILWHHVFVLRYARVPERTLPIACLCLAGLVAFAVDRGLRARPRWSAALVAVALVAVAADLHVSRFRPTEADTGNRAYIALARSGPGRVVELPVTDPGDDLGSVYLGYIQQAPRERLLGYSTLARPAARTVARTLSPLNCGVLGPEQKRLLEADDVRYVLVHRALYWVRGHVSELGPMYRGLRAAGFYRVRRSGAIGLWRRDGAVHTTTLRPDLACRRWLKKAF